MFVAAILAFALYSAGNAEAEAPPVHHTVQSGETLWEITTEYYSPSEDPRPRIEEIRAANDLTDFRIHPGQRLELPPSD